MPSKELNLLKISLYKKKGKLENLKEILDELSLKFKALEKDISILEEEYASLQNSILNEKDTSPKH